MRKMTSLPQVRGTIGAVLVIAGAAPSPAHSPAAHLPATSGIIRSVADEARCSGLVGRKFGAATIESAVYVERGVVVGAGSILGDAKAPANLCRVRARINVVPGSEIRSELWLPDAWNGNLLGIGGAGYGGSMIAAPLVLTGPTAKGYATFDNDAGHPAGGDAKWALGAHEKVIDWAYRANHQAAVFAKAVVADYFGRPARQAYFHGCSNGGRDALMEARRYPEDYDGIVAGAPAADWTGMTSAFVWNWQTMFKTPGASLLHTKIKLVADAVMAKCDMIDGVKDGVLENPQLCRFDPAELQCKGADGPSCLNAAEVGALRKIYRGPRLRDGRIVFGGVPMGNEDIPDNEHGWVDSGPLGTGAFGAEFFRWMVYQDPKWSPASFDLDRDYATAVKRMGPIVDSHDPDLRAFTKRGGKLIIYHGWSDGRIPAEASVRYYEAVRRRIGPSVANKSVRLFMVPGMAHCSGGPGPDTFDMVRELDAWVTKGTPPERVIATKYDKPDPFMMGPPGKVLETRPLCAWPKTEHYTGKGSTSEAANFVCR